MEIGTVANGDPAPAKVAAVDGKIVVHETDVVVEVAKAPSDCISGGLPQYDRVNLTYPDVHLPCFDDADADICHCCDSF